MTPKERLVTVREGESREVVLAKMHEKRVEKALVVDDELPPDRHDHRERLPESRT
ncbi:hypothetical protein MJ524_21185 [Escherichia coli]|nr:hypothetical protein MJ524_21185 [Escherichia coli]